MDLAYCRYTRCQCCRLHSLYLQGMVAATTDYFVYRFGCRYFDHTTAKWILFCHLSCWFTFYTLVRTYSNCMETLFTMMALSYWPWNFLMVAITLARQDFGLKYWCLLFNRQNTKKTTIQCWQMQIGNQIASKHYVMQLLESFSVQPMLFCGSFSAASTGTLSEVVLSSLLSTYCQ